MKEADPAVGESLSVASQVVAAPRLNRVEDHPAYIEAQARRAANLKFGNWFIGSLWFILVGVAVVYVWLHVQYTPSATLWSPSEVVQFDSAGRLVRVSEEDLRWYIGSVQTTALVAGLKERTQRIDALEDKVVRQAVLEFEVRFSSNGQAPVTARKAIESFVTAARSGRFARAAAEFVAIVEGWTDETRKLVGEKSILDVGYGLGELTRLRSQQYQVLGQVLAPPLIHQIFWMSPVGALAEAILWSLFGTLTNLIIHASHYRARGNYRRDEAWVSISKLFYGPVLSLALVLAIYFGLLNASEEVRFWFLPMAGFLFGYNTRKTAKVIDRLSEKLLGAAAASAEPQIQEQVKGASHAAANIRASARPANLEELKEQAHMVAETATVAAVINQQRKS